MAPPKKRQFRKRAVSEEADDETTTADAPTTSNGEATPGGDDSVSSVLQEALELRKFRKRAAGLDISDLNRGDRRKQKEKPVEDDPWKLKSGGGIINIDEVRGKSFGGDEKAGAGGGGSFATASNAMDTDRHMQDFIEKELRKRRGQTEDGPATESPSDAPKDFHDELFQIPDHLKTAEKAVSEGNVTLSTAMLTAIPEIDLGMSVKLKNIEETERAKRKLLDRTTGGGDDKLSSGRIGRNEFAGANAVASERYWTGPKNMPQRRPEDGDAPAGEDDGSKKRFDRRTMATDEMVMERFKKRIRRN